MSRYVSMAYPSFRLFNDIMELLPISTKSVIIKCCQAQLLPITPTAPLRLLLDKEPPVRIDSRHHFARNGVYTVYDLLLMISFDPSDPLDAAIYLDIVRFSSSPDLEIENTKAKSWKTEVDLAMGTFRDEPIHWDTIFSSDRSKARIPLHPELPINEPMANSIHLSLQRFKRRVEGSTLYARATHKNMSWQTRRDFEDTFHTSLDNEGIFGQDDYLRVYHETGILLGGATEMRQKWYHSGAKPRTYFAMGGDAYQHSRFLQDVFSQLVDEFPSFNHKTRLRPGRLVVPQFIEDEDVHWRIYDLSSFTSNCCVQRSFVEELSYFLRGVNVTIVDERSGPQLVDLGDLMYAYWENCVVRPPLSLERFDSSFRDVTFFHEVASMLGIFGNLMTCTFAHGTIVGMSSPDVVDDQSYNCAGDDGLIPERMSTEFYIDRGIRLVGSYERTKSFKGDDEGPICLKRPFIEAFPCPDLGSMIIPPTLATVVSLLDPKYSDPRYTSLDERASLHWTVRVSIVGKDLLRFLRSAYRLGYGDSARLSFIYDRFCMLVRRFTTWNCSPGLGVPGVRPFWPVNPLEYEFADVSPLTVLLLYYGPPRLRAEKREMMADVSLQYWRAGDVFEQNKTNRLRLLEMLGYVTTEEVWEEVTELQKQENTLSLVLEDLYEEAIDDPKVYTFTLICDIPWFFMYSE